MRLRTCRMIAAAVLVALASSARADLIFGTSSRSAAMGGAGLALRDRSAQNLSLNPASLADVHRGFQMGFPSLGVRTTGALNLGTAFKYLGTTPSDSEAT